MTNEMTTKIRELMSDEEFFETVMNDNLSAEELHELLKEHDVEISAEELVELSKQGVNQIVEAGYITEDGELSEDALEAVAGGGKKAGKTMIVAGAGAMGVALLSDACAGAFAVAIVSNPVGWFFGGAALMVAGAYVVGRSKSKKKG